jgi:hypothetical protein
MKNIFHKLPQDMINYILLYNEHFSMRKGKIISIISKTDDRYNLIKRTVSKKIDIVRRSNKENISGVMFLKIFQESFYYPWAFYPVE